MSKLYDDLKRKSPEGAGPAPAEQLDLFAYAQQQKADKNAGAPPRIIESLPKAAPEEPSQATPASLFRRGLEHRAPLFGVIEPLSRLPPLGKKKRPWLVYLLGTLALVVLTGVLTIFLRTCAAAGRKSQPPESTSAAQPERAHPAPPLVHPVQPVVASPPTPVAQGRPDRLPQPKSVPPADTPAGTLRVPGASIATAGHLHVVRFHDGIFSGATRIKPEAAQALRSLAKQLAPYGRRVSITVIGCTDNTPLNPGSRFADNTELGLARAQEVVHFLKQSGLLPFAQFHTMSYGEKWSPYPNDTPVHRAKNRTVVLRILIKD